MDYKVTNAVYYSDYRRLPTGDRRWIWERMLPAGGLGLLYGPAKRARKSFFSWQFCLAVATGEPFLGIPTTQGTCFYLQLDTPRIGWQDRFERLETEYGVIVPPSADKRLVIADTDLAPYPFDIQKPHCAGWLATQMATFQPDLVIIDTFRRAHMVSEDKSETITPVINAVQHCCRPAAVLLVGHGRKPNPDYDGGVLNEGRGSTAIPAACDLILRIRPKTKKHPTMLDWEGRSCESAELPLEDEPSLFYRVGAEQDFQFALQETLHNSFPSLNKAAEHLAMLSGRPKEACRTALRRAKGVA